MAIIKCKMCGGDVEVAPGATVVECRFCGMVQAVPNENKIQQVEAYIRQNFTSANKLSAIKYYREQAGAGLKDAKDAVDCMF